MLTAPYSIYANHRPLRVAFLIEDKPESLAIVDTILSYNRDRWGGRYNPIVITDGQTLSDAWWSFLEVVDPDVVTSFVTLSDNLVASIERRISPYLIQQPNDAQHDHERWRPRLPDEGLSLLPSPANVRMASGSSREPSLVLFEMDREKTDSLTTSFIEWNFGEYSESIHVVSEALDLIRTQPYRVTDAASLVTPFTELSTFRPFTYPIQLCSVPMDALPQVEHGRFAETFHVVVGDTAADVAYFWNRPATIPQWTRTQIRQVWLPLGLATNAQLASALSSWFQRMADPNGSYRGSIRFVSLSLSQAQLEAAVAPLTGNVRVPRYVNALERIEAPKIGERVPGPPSLDRLDLYRASGTTERLTLREPDVAQGPSLDECWMADLFIEFRPERYSMISGRPLWWQLPRLNSLAWWTFRRQSRILRNRYPSVLMRRGAPRIDITLPDDISIFAILARSENSPYYTLDARHEQTLPGRTPYYHVQRSEKGRYLSGLLDLFGGLVPATRYLEERYWRRMFDLLSGRTAHTDAEQLTKVGNKLRKRLGANHAQFYEDDKEMTWLTNYVLQVARALPASSRDLEFRDFEDCAEQEMEDFNASRPGKEPGEYVREDLVNALAGLTERGVLLMGVRARCPSCGYRAWHHIDDAKQTLQCGGCSATFPMPPEQRWHYRLNSLALAAYAKHGLLPVVLVLGQLLKDARTGFVFAPCLDLFEKDDKGPMGDLDIAVIVDGQFVIGEVKQSRALFDEATFAKMESIARRLLPDVLLFASMDREPTERIRKEMARMSEALQPLGITVRWYPLHA